MLHTGSARSTPKPHTFANTHIPSTGEVICTRARAWDVRAMFERAKVKGITFKLAKSTICTAEVKWFGPVFSAAGVLADPEKIQHIVQAGQPKTIEDVWSLLQAAAYNAKYGFDHLETKSSQASNGSCHSVPSYSKLVIKQIV